MPVIDAHIHLFEHPYGALYDNAHVKEGAAGELHLFEQYRSAYDVERAFVICYAQERWPENNRYVEGLRAEHPWIVSFGHLRVDPTRMATSARELLERGHRGLSCYPPAGSADWLGAPQMDAFWALLQARRVPLSLNLSAHQCTALAAVLDRYPGVTLLLSHMARPQLHDGQLDEADYAPLLNLARYPSVYVKLSGFYAFVPDGWRFPQRALFSVVDRLAVTFGPQRLLWASDFAPALEYNTYRQALELLRSEYRGFAEHELADIYYHNACRLLAESQ